MSARAECRKCHKTKKKGKMSRRDKAFCSGCVKAQAKAVKSRRRQLVKAGIVTVTKGAKGRSVVKAARPYAPQPGPRTLADAVPWNPVFREQARLQPGGPAQQDLVTAHNVAKATGCRSVRELYETTAQRDIRELARRVMLMTGERF